MSKHPLDMLFSTPNNPAMDRTDLNTNDVSDLYTISAFKEYEVVLLIQALKLLKNDAKEDRSTDDISEWYYQKAKQLYNRMKKLTP